MSCYTAMDISISVSEVRDQEHTTSLLNHNVSFDTSVETSLVTNSPVARRTDSSMASLSFSLSETERLKLKQMQSGSNGNANNNNRSQRSVLKDLPINVENQREENTEISTLEESSVVMVEEEEDSTLDDSSRIINLEDTVNEPSCAAEAATVEEKMTVEEEQEVTDQTNDTCITSASTVVPQIAYFQEQLVELGRRCWPSTAQKQHYTKGCYWSPDGTCLLLPVHQDGMHVMELPQDLYNAHIPPANRSLSKLQSAVHVPEGGTVYDCVWYPLMSSQDPDTCL